MCMVRVVKLHILAGFYVVNCLFSDILVLNCNFNTILIEKSDGVQSNYKLIKSYLCITSEE
jgi:hypothetical protein